MKRHPHILQRKQSALLVIDVQEKISAVMLDREFLLKNTVKLIKGCQVLGVPIFMTEQYPKGLGPTEADLVTALGDLSPIQKMTFSCCGAAELMAGLRKKSIKQVMLTGIEAHVCVQQTALDLLANGYQVHIIRDAVSSRKTTDADAALARLQNAGAVITTTEAALFELLERAGTPQFKEISQLVK
jgi:nicotinamidase-related amidase